MFHSKYGWLVVQFSLNTFFFPFLLLFFIFLFNFNVLLNVKVTSVGGTENAEYRYCEQNIERFTKRQTDHNPTGTASNVPAKRTRKHDKAHYRLMCIW